MTTKHHTYTSEEYNSNEGMLTAVWGPSLWHFLHTLSFNYPINPTSIQKKQYRDFIYSLQYILPCRYCRENLKKNLKSVCFNDKCLKNRETFSRAIYELHNHINVMLGKKKYKTYEEVRDCYENFRARCKLPIKKTCKQNLKGLTKSNNNKKSSKKEKGCVNPLYGIKSKCVINIVPKTCKKNTFNVDKQCLAIRK